MVLPNYRTIILWRYSMQGDGKPINDRLTVRIKDAISYSNIGRRIADQLYRKKYKRLNVRLELVSIDSKKGTATYVVKDELRGRKETKAPEATKNSNRVVTLKA